MRRHLPLALAVWALAVWTLATAGAGPLPAPPGLAQSITACGATCGRQSRICRANMVRTGRYGSRCAHRLRACHEACRARAGRPAR